MSFKKEFKCKLHDKNTAGHSTAHYNASTSEAKAGGL
jgi:hypothetical protein